MNDPRSAPLSTPMEPAGESLLPLWSDPLEDAISAGAGDARRFLPEPWLLTPAERQQLSP